MNIRQSQGGRQLAWTREEVIAGISKFIEEKKRFPKGIEFDSFPYLPSIRSIQRAFGGLVNLKKEMGVNESYHSGEYRSAIARKINLRGQMDEQAIGIELERRFGEVCVHYQGLAGSRKERLDFVVFHKLGKFGVDTFFPEDVVNLGAIINIKQRKYQRFENPIFFVVMNKSISPDQIQDVIRRKDNILQTNIVVLSLGAFMIKLEEFKRREVL